MELAPAATRGHRSAASLATGPVIAEPEGGVRGAQSRGATERSAPFISPLGFTITPALSGEAGAGGEGGLQRATARGAAHPRSR